MSRAHICHCEPHYSDSQHGTRESSMQFFGLVLRRLSADGKANIVRSLLLVLASVSADSALLSNPLYASRSPYPVSSAFFEWQKMGSGTRKQI